MSDAIISIKNVNKVFPGIKAVDDANIDIRPNEFFALLGPSGCGKTTLLRMIAGLESITSGDLEIAGKRVNDVDPRDRDVAMVFQSYALYPHLTVFENMVIPAFARSPITTSTSLISSGSRADVGSSSTMKSGLLAMARATAIRCR